MPLKISVDVNSRSQRWTLADARAIKRAVQKTLHGFLPAKTTAHVQLSVTLSTNNYVKRLNTEWRGKQKPTNILSFPAGELENIKTWPAKLPLPLGDLVLGHEICVRESKQFGIRLHHHLMHLAVHGTLHLLGYDHETDADHRKMLRAELRVLYKLGLANPYPFMQNSPRNV